MSASMKKWNTRNIHQLNTWQILFSVSVNKRKLDYVSSVHYDSHSDICSQYDCTHINYHSRTRVPMSKISQSHCWSLVTIDWTRILTISTAADTHGHMTLRHSEELVLMEDSDLPSTAHESDCRKGWNSALTRSVVGSWQIRVKTEIQTLRLRLFIRLCLTFNQIFMESLIVISRVQFIRGNLSATRFTDLLLTPHTLSL